MEVAFYIAVFVSLISTIMVITRFDPVHALLYLVVSFLSLSVVFFILGAPFAALLEVIIYAGAIMVLFIFVVMLLNLGKKTAEQESAWLKPRIWIGPSVLAAVLLVEMFYLFTRVPSGVFEEVSADPKILAVSLYREYFLAVVLAAMLLMAGVVGAAHVGKHKKINIHRFLKEGENL